MNRPILLPVVLLLILPVEALAQTVRGTVVEEGTGRPLSGAVVEVQYRGTVLTNMSTDSAGGFLMFPRVPGTVLIRVAHPFYASGDPLRLVLEAGETVTIELRMARAAVPLEPLVITARTRARLADFHQRRNRAGGFGQYLTREEIATRPGARTTDLLRPMLGVEVTSFGRGGSDQPSAIGTPDPTVPRVNIIMMQRSGGACIPAIFVDGLSIRQYSESGIDEFLKPDMIEGVEVYPGSVGAPAEFVDPGMCGVVAFWTRSGLGEGRRWSWARAAAGATAFVVLVVLTR